MERVRIGKDVGLACGLRARLGGEVMEFRMGLKRARGCGTWLRGKFRMHRKTSHL